MHMDSDEKQLPSTLPPRSSVWDRIRLCGSTITLTFATTLLMASTIFFSYNSSLQQPYLSIFAPQNPSRSILILNVASNLTLFLLANLTATILESIRWTLACHGTGIPALTFFTLSTSTGFLGSVFLAFGKNRVPGSFPVNDHRVWGIQRAGLMLLRVALGVVLLADVSFQRTYHSVHQIPVLQAGLPPMNTTFPSTDWFQITATDYFWFYFPALLADAKISEPVAPVSCTGLGCQGYFLPGLPSYIHFDPTTPNLTATEYPDATTFIQQNAPGYQLDFSDIDVNKDPSVTLEDCRVYGLSILALQICLKQDNNSMLAAWSSCGYSLGSQGLCLNTTSWRTSSPFNTKMTILSRNASTVFNRTDFNILQVMDLSPPIPQLYAPNVFFSFFDVIFSINTTQPDFDQSSQYALLFMLSNYLQRSRDDLLDTGGGTRKLRLQDFLATPIAVFNDGRFPVSNEDVVPGMGTSISMAVPGYQLILSPVTLYLFLFGGLVSLIWCIVGLIIIIMGETPRTTIISEIDVITKIATSTQRENPPQWGDSGQASAFAGLRDANSLEVRNRLAGTKIHIPVQAAVLLDRDYATAERGTPRLSGRPHSEQGFELFDEAHKRTYI